MPPHIFISYRRADSKHITSRIRERLTDAFGVDAVFHDVEKIPPGSDFRSVLREATASCRVMLVVIGKGWVNATDASGNRRLDNPGDFVRIEVETGLLRDGVTVIPLLVDGADMPAESQLPDSLKLLAYKNAFVMHDDPIFAHDMETLSRYLRLLLRNSNKGMFRRAGAVLLASLILIIALSLVVPQVLSSLGGLQTQTGVDFITSTPATPENATNPVDVVEAYLSYKVIGDRTGMGALLCSGLQGNIDHEATVFAGTSARIETMQCTSGTDTNFVSCTGMILADFGSGITGFPLGTYRVLLEDGMWKWCGEAS